MDKDNTEWFETYPAEAMAIDRRTYLMSLRYLASQYKGEYEMKATMLLVGDRSGKNLGE